MYTRQIDMTQQITIKHYNCDVSLDMPIGQQQSGTAMSILCVLHFVTIPDGVCLCGMVPNFWKC